jgi:amidophosphoribosyltransferase
MSSKEKSQYKNGEQSQNGQRNLTNSDRSALAATAPRARCSFEHIYFGRPDSILWGQSSLVKRCNLGAALAKESPVDADLVMAIPDSGVPIAVGYAEESGIPYKIGLIRNHYVGRTFIEPTQLVRNFRVKLKLNPVKEVVQGKRLIVVDDSIVRGTTSKRIIEILREAGAKEVHVRIGSPQVKYPCYYGIDTPKRRELLAQTHTLAEMRDYLGADSLAFLQIDTMVKVMNQNFIAENQTSILSRGAGESKSQTQWCTSCFSGSYQDKYAQSACTNDVNS